MQVSRTISTVEVHTGGEPFRIVTSGLPRLQGDSIVERRAWVREHADNIRQALMFEPRGHADMYGGYLTPPVSPTADFGVIFLHNEGYSDHCGHGVIALATAAVELGWVQRESPETRVGIDAPCGFIEAFVKWDGMHANGVRFINRAIVHLQARRERRDTDLWDGERRHRIRGGVLFLHRRRTAWPRYS